MAGSRLDQLLRRAGEQDGSVMDDHDLVAHRLHILDDVGGEQYQPVLRCTGEQIAEVDALLRVQSHRGLVKDQEGGIPQQSLRNPHPLALAAGEGADFGFCLFFQIDRLDCLLDCGLGICRFP